MLGSGSEVTYIRRLSLGMLVCAGVFIWGQVSFAEKSESDSQLIHEVFALACAHKVSQLLLLNKEVQMRDHLVKNSYNLALYISNPPQFLERYVNSFPEDFGGIQEDGITLENRYELGFLPFRAIGNIAEAGNQKAILKVLNAWQHSDGFVAEYFADAIAQLTNTQPTALLGVLANKSAEYRKQFSCSPQIRGTLKRSKLLTLSVSESVDKQALDDLKAALKGCNYP